GSGRAAILTSCLGVKWSASIPRGIGRLLTWPAGGRIVDLGALGNKRMGMEIRQLHPVFVGEVSGIDLAQPLDLAVVRTLWEAIDLHAVLVFHEQSLSDAQLRDFARNFGSLEIGRSAAEGGKRRLALPEIGDISNLDEEGRLGERNDRRRLDSLGNRIWHTEASYMPVPVVLGILHAVAVPPGSALGGGETEFADMRAAYDALPETMKDAIDGLVAEHDIFWSRG